MNEISAHKKLLVLNALNMLAEEGEISFEDEISCRNLARAIMDRHVMILEEKWATGIPVDQISEWIECIDTI